MGEPPKVAGRAVEKAVAEVVEVAHPRLRQVRCPKGRTGIPTLAASGIFRTLRAQELKELMRPPVAVVALAVVAAELVVVVRPVALRERWRISLVRTAARLPAAQHVAAEHPAALQVVAAVAAVEHPDGFSIRQTARFPTSPKHDSSSRTSW